MTQRSLTIHLEDMHFQSFIGVYAEERSIGNEFLVSLSLDIPAPNTDNWKDALPQTVDYSKAYALVCDVMGTSCHLMETAARNMETALLESYPGLLGLEIRIRKLHPPLPGKVSASSITWRYRSPKIRSI